MGVECPKCNTENTSDSEFCKKCATPLPSSKETPASPTKTLEAPTEELTTGSTFAGRYQIIEELGKGGMGKVYKAHDTEIKEKIALKLINPEIAANKKTIDRFQNELKFARKISHRNVCRMYDLNKEEGSYYITMEYVEGQDLRGLIRQSRQLTVGTTINIAKQVSEGLAEAHKLGVVHRDLKPSNVMIDKQGNARIMDFGIARSLKAKGITGAGVMIGTPEYMSPEQVEGKKVDQRSDIYSLGVILYEMVTGRVPFEGDTPLSIAVKHKTETPKEPRELNTQIPEDLSKVILRCMEKDKEKRYQIAEELLSELSKIEETKPETIKIPEWKNSIAVLPFKNMSADPEQEYFCEGLAEELINVLTHIKDLRVVARTSAFSFKGEKIDIREVGQKLNVDKVLEGSVRKAGNRLRITAQLINVADGYHLWSERYDRNMEDIFAIQDEISLAIVDKLKVKLLKGEKSKIIKRCTDNIEAYNLYLKGRFFWNKRTEDGLKKSVENFEKAIEKDPGFALAYAGLADSISTQGFYDFILPRKDAFSIAREHALKALELDATVGETHAAMANIKAWCDYDWEGAEQEYKKALKLNPSDAEAHHMYSHFLSGLGRFDEALFEMRRALALEPLSVNLNNCLGIIFFTARRYDEAIEQFRVSIELDPSFSLQHYWLGRAYLEKRMNKQAIETLNKATKFPEIHTMALSALGYSYAVIGKRDKAQDVLNKLKDLYKKKYVDPFHKALAYIGLGENELALAYLKQAYEERSMYNVYLSTDPIFDSLRDDSRFKILLKKIGLEY